MGFKQLDFQEFTGEDMQSRSETFLNEMSKRIVSKQLRRPHPVPINSHGSLWLLKTRL